MDEKDRKHMTRSGLQTQFTDDKLRELLAARITHHKNGVAEYAPKVEAAKAEYNKVEQAVRTRGDNSNAAMAQLDELGQKYMSLASQHETHQRWATFLAFYSGHLGPGLHVLSLDDLKQLDLIELPQDFGYAMIPVPGRRPDHHTLAEIGPLGPPGRAPRAPYAGFG